MKRNRKYSVRAFKLLVLLFFSLSTVYSFQDTATADDGRPAKMRVKAISGPELKAVTVEREGRRAELYRCERVGEGDRIMVGGGGWVEFKLPEKGDGLKLASPTNMVISKMEKGKMERDDEGRSVKISLALEGGLLRARLDKGSNSILIVKTDNAEVKIERADCIFGYDAPSGRSVIMVKGVYDNGSVNVKPIGVSEYREIDVPQGKKIEIVGAVDNFIVEDAGGGLLRLAAITRFVDEKGVRGVKMMGVRGVKDEGKPTPDINGEAEDFVRRFVSYLNSESVSGIRGMVSSRYSGSIGGFGGKTALVNGLKEQFDTGGRVRLSYSISSASATDKEGREIIVNARIGGGGVKLWIVKEGSSYLLTHAEGRWFYE